MRGRRRCNRAAIEGLLFADESEAEQEHVEDRIVPLHLPRGAHYTGRAIKAVPFQGFAPAGESDFRQAS